MAHILHFVLGWQRQGLGIGHPHPSPIPFIQTNSLSHLNEKIK